MRVLLVLAGVLLAGYGVADRVRQLSGRADAAVSTYPYPATPALASVSQPIAPPRLEAPSSTPAALAAAEQPVPRTHPVALVALDAATARFPAKPSDPIGQFALVLPASAAPGGGQAAEPRWWLHANAPDLTGDVTNLRLAWPHAGAVLASAVPDDLPSSPSSVGAMSVGAEGAASSSSDGPERVSSVEVPGVAAGEPVSADMRDRPAVAVPVAHPPMPLARGESRPRSGAKTRARTRPQPLPAPPARRLASAASDTGVVERARPSLACASPTCGPRLLLLGVGF